jgi:hypothetical protein
MIVAQITTTIFVISIVVCFVAAQYVDHRDREFSWIDYVGAGAMAISIISGILAVLAMIWGF